MNERSNVNAFACSQEEFKRLIEDERLQQGIIYFVGDSNTIGQGVSLAKKGTIYLATSKKRAVPFVGFTSTDDLQRQINEVKETSEKQLQSLTFKQEELTDKVENLSEKIFKWEWETPTYDATKVGEYYGILRFQKNECAKLTISSGARGSKGVNTILLASGTNGTSITSLIETAFEISENEDEYYYLLLPYPVSPYEPIKRYTATIDYYDGDGSEILFYDDVPFQYSGEIGSKIIIKTPSVKVGAREFDINSDNVQWVTSDVFDYIGNVNVDINDGLTLRNVTAFESGTILTLSLTKNVRGGIVVKNSQGTKTLCEVQGDVFAGDLITFTITEDGWLANLSRSSIVCEDGTINIEVVGGVTYISAIQQPPQRIELTSEDESVTITETENGYDFSVPSGGGANIESSDGSIVINDSPTPNTKDLTLPKDVIRNHSTIQETYNDKTLAIGHNSQCGYSNNIALGNSAKANGDQSVSVGTRSESSGTRSCAYGFFANASGSGSFAFGYNSTANGLYSTANGNYSTASGNYSTANGSQSTASGSDSTAVGYNSKANSNDCVSVGYNSNSYGARTIALGSNSISNQFIGAFIKSELKDFEIDGATCKIYKSLANETKLVAIEGVDYEVELQANHIFFFLSVKLDFANSLTFEIDGLVTQIQGFTTSANNYISFYPVTELTNSLFGYHFSASNPDYSPINLSTHTYFFGIEHSTSTSFPQNGIAVGYKSFTRGDYAIAIGSGASAMADRQIVFGTFNEESATDKFQIGNGAETQRHNLAVIDQYERFICKKQVANGIWKYDNQSSLALSFTPSDSNFKGAQTIVVSSVPLSGSSSIAMNIKHKEPIEGETLTIFAKNYPIDVYDDNGSIVLIQSGKFAELIYLDGQWYSKQY